MKHQFCASFQLQSNLTEARGLVAEMLANKDLPPTVISGLKAVATLLNPQPVCFVFQKKFLFSYIKKFC